MPQFCYLNGKLVPERTAKVSVLDRGLLLGEGVFETMRAYDGRIFALDRHLDRLRHGADVLGLTMPFGLRAGLEELLIANKLRDARVRLTVTSGPGGPGLLGRDVEPTVVALAHPMEDTGGPKTAIILPMRKYAAASLVGVKTISYGENLIGRKMAAEGGVDEGIFLNTDGDVCEGTASNVFLIRYGELYTPGVGSGCLPGITREVALECAPAAGLTPHEGSISPIDLAQAEEAFLTSSTREIMPLVAVDGRPIGDGSPGEATARLHDAYRKFVASSA